MADSGRKTSDKSDKEVKKKTSEKKPSKDSTDKSSTEKRGPGRPPGTKNSSGKKSSSKKTANESEASENKSKTSKTASESRIKDEITAVFLLAAGIFLIMAVFTEAAGDFGTILSFVLKGLFGHTALILPFFVIICSVMIFTNRMARINSRTIFFSALLFLDISMLNSARFEEVKAADFGIKYIEDMFYSGAVLESAGAVGMTTGWAAARCADIAGLIIAGIAIMAVCLILITNTPVSVFLDRRKMKHRMRAIERQEAAEAYEKERAEQEKLYLAEGTAALNEKKRRGRQKKEQLPEHSVEDIQREADMAAAASAPVSAPQQRPTAEKEYEFRNIPPAEHIEGASASALAGIKAKGAAIFRNFKGAGTAESAEEMTENQKNIVKYMNDENLFGKDSKKVSADEDLRKYKPSDFFYDMGERAAENKNAAEKPSSPAADTSDRKAAAAALRARAAAAVLGDAGYAANEKVPASGLSHSGASIASFDDGAAEMYGNKGRAPSDSGMTAYHEEAAAAREEFIPEEIIDIPVEIPHVQPAPAPVPMSGIPPVPQRQPAPAAQNAPQVPQEMTRGEMKAAVKAGAAELGAQIAGAVQVKKEYRLPPISLLNESERKVNANEQYELKMKADKLESVFHDFGVNARVIDVKKGPSVTRYEIQPATGVKVSSITKLADDIALNLEARSLRIEAPIPGKAAVGIEVENESSNTVTLREMIESREFEGSESKITFVVGEDISGNHVVADLKSMPHLLIAGSTGSGKSVCINSIIMSMLYKSTPDEVRFILIDPKVVELGNYNGIPHMLIPVVTDPSKAAAALAWAVNEMNDRYKKFAECSVRDLKSYNAKMKKEGEEDKVLPQIVIIIDELADLMMAAAKQVEESICRLAQLARAAGMHLIIATQRPSVDVVTGLIKANVPSRIAFAVSSQVDSRTILDRAGAEKLVGKGDMLFNPLGKAQAVRLQGPFVTDDEVNSVIDFWKEQADSDDSAAKILQAMNTVYPEASADDEECEDERLQEAIELVISTGQASASMLQRRYRMGYARAGRLIDIMEMRGIIGPSEGSKPRRVLVTKEEYERMQMQQNSCAAEPEEKTPEPVPENKIDNLSQQAMTAGAALTASGIFRDSDDSDHKNAEIPGSHAETGAVHISEHIDFEETEYDRISDEEDETAVYEASDEYFEKEFGMSEFDEEYIQEEYIDGEYYSLSADEIGSDGSSDYDAVYCQENADDSEDYTYDPYDSNIDN